MWKHLFVACVGLIYIYIYIYIYIFDTRVVFRLPWWLRW